MTMLLFINLCIFASNDFFKWTFNHSLCRSYLLETKTRVSLNKTGSYFSKNHKACYLSISFITDGLHTLHNVQSSDYSEFTASLNGILKAALSLDTVLTALMGKATVFSYKTCCHEIRTFCCCFFILKAPCNSHLMNWRRCLTSCRSKPVNTDFS